MSYLSLLWQVPAIFTAVPLVHRMLPFKLAARAIPLFYAIVSLVVMTMPDRLDLALAAAGLVSLAHNRMGIRLAQDPPPDMKLVRETVANWSALTWDYISTRLPRSLASRLEPILDDKPGDGNPEDASSKDEHYQEPPKPPDGKVPPRIPHL